MTPKLVNVPLFKFYAQKVLPTVYDDALSYQEVLMKIAAKLDELIIANNAQNDVINNLPTDVAQFAEMLREFKVEMEGEFDTFTEAINASIEEFETEVNNKIITDNTPTQGSEHLVTSNGVWASIKTVTDSLVKDLAPTENSSNFVTSGGVYTAIQNAITNLTTAINAKQDRLTFDTEPTQNSVNPVQSGGIYTAIQQAKTDASNALDTYAETMSETIGDITDDISALQTSKQDTLTFDTTPTEGSTNPVTSEGIARAIEQAVPTITIDPTPAQGSSNAVSSGGVYAALQNERESTDLKLSRKQDTLAFDMTPTQNSTNPVYSGGVWEALAQISPSVTIDAFPTEGSAHAVSSGGVYEWTHEITDAIEQELDGKQDELTFDTEPTENSQNMLNSGAIWLAIQNVTIDTDAVPTYGSTNPVESGGVYNALLGKQDTLTFDSAPSQGSNNPVRSGGIYNSLGGVSTLTFLEAYNSTVENFSAGYVFTPKGAYNMYTNISNTITSVSDSIPTIAGQVAGQVVGSALPTVVTKVLPSKTTDFSIAVADWTNGQATVSGTFNVSGAVSNEIVPTIGERATWDYYGVYPIGITASSITFQCATTPTGALTFKVMQTPIQNA